MSAGDRIKATREFTRGGARVLLATDAASEGLNLHERCRLVVNFDLPWTPVRLEQRVGRVDRIGQRRRVHVWQLVGDGTYDDTVAERLKARSATALATMELLSHGGENDTAAAVLAAGELFGATPAETRPVQVVRTPNTTLANDEAERILRGRRLIERASPGYPNRPFYARLTGRDTGSAFLGFRLIFSDPSGRHSWETIAAAVPSSQPIDLTGRDWWPLAFDFGLAVAESVSLTACYEMRRLRRAAATALRRDRAIVGTLNTERARLSAALLQPDLFFNRLQRSVTPQLQLLDESLDDVRRASNEVRSIRQVELVSISTMFAGQLHRQ